jgi:hypothetical protein
MRMSADNAAPNPEWFDVVLMMQNMGRTLPGDWDHGSDFWLGGAQQLAELVVACKGKVPIETVAAAIGAGGMMVAHAERQAEAANLTDALLERVRRNGGAQ